MRHPGRSSEGVTRRMKPFTETVKHELVLKRRSGSGEETGGQNMPGRWGYESV